MAMFDSYEQGTPCWIEYGSADQGASKEFYARVFGWDYVDTPIPDDDGNQIATYSLARLDGDTVAGLGPILAPAESASWVVYLAVDDVDATVEKARAAGAPVHVEPMDVAGQCRMAWIEDTGGAHVGLWQDKGLAGAQRANEPNTFIWNELTVDDLAGTARFYADLLGMEVQSADTGPDNPAYTMLAVGGRTVAGTMPIQADMRPHWNVYFSVEDVDATVALALELGAKEFAPSFDVPGAGRLGYLCDPQGAHLNLMQTPTTD